MTQFGYARITGRSEEAYTHLRVVTGMTVTQAWDHVHVAEELWVERSQRMWELDLRMLIGAGVTLRRPERAADRAAVAARALRRERTEFSSNGAVIEDM